MNRRRLIKLAALSLAGLLAPAAGLRPLRADTVFRDMFGDDALATRLGKLHQRQDPAAGARGRSLVADLAGCRLTVREKRLRERTEADLAALDVATVDGWVLARTEADLCAAVHLDRSLA